MNRILFLLGVILASCSHHQTKPEIKTSSEDSTISKIMDSLVLDTPDYSEFKGQAGFLSNNFEDTVVLKRIQSLVKRIDSYKIKDSVEIENEDYLENMTDGGGSLTGYFLNKKLVKIQEWVGLSWGVLQVSFYFDNDYLVFVRETEDHFYVDSNGTDHSKIDLRFRGEYYFDKNKLVGQVSLGHNRFENDNNDPEREYLKKAKENRELILKKKK